MLNKQQLRKDVEGAHAPNHPSHVSPAGSSKQKSRAAAHMYWERLLKRENTNDNKRHTVFSKLRTAVFVFAAFICGTVLGINSSAIATQAVLHTDDRVLKVAMDTSPEMLGRILNVMEVGG